MTRLLARTLVLTAAAATPVAAQTAPLPAVATAATGSRAEENAVRQAGDAFGTSIGRETIGLYNTGNVRGFSPVAAGNVRIDGLYFDPVITPDGRISRTTTVRVGLSALGNPFPAPTGLVDFGFRRPGHTAATSVQVAANAWGTFNAEIDAVLPVASSLSVGLGASVKREIGFDATRENEIGGALMVNWTPAPGVSVLPFISVVHTLLDDHRLTYLTAGEFLPPPLPRRQFFGPDWVRGTGTEANAGVLGDWQIAPSWLLRAGIFRSARHRDDQYTNLVRNLRPDRTGRQQVIADPRLVFGSTSGEVRLSHRIDAGALHHQFHVAMRGRASDRRFGGSATLDLGPVQIDTPSKVPKITAKFGPQQQDAVRQWTAGLAYEGVWDGVGLLSAGLQYSDYRKRIDVAGGGIQATDARPLLYNFTVAANLAPRLSAYAGAVTGLEESGIAPGNAANRNEALPAIKTRQFDAGLRYALTEDVKIVAGVFDISKPYFNLDANNRFDALGQVINRGIETSIAGPVTSQLSIVAGAVLLWPKVTGEAVAKGRVGPRPVGAIGQRVEFSADWRPAFAPGVSFDGKLAWRSAETATVSNRVQIPGRARVDVGGRYRFRLGGKAALFRVQVTNLFDGDGFEQRGAGAYGPIEGRQVQGYVTVDF